MEHNSRVVFSQDVWKRIEWFTNNLNTEIGALGRVNIKKDKNNEKYFYVDKLYFPQQEVTGATVKFTPEMWGQLVKEHGLKEMGKAAFYWHRHPGNSAHSGTDDADTFETFMDPTAKRPYFIFMQTAVTAKGEWDEELRIDIATPIRTTITNSKIDCEIEETQEDKGMIKECEKIRDTVIVKSTAQKWPNYSSKKVGGGNSSSGQSSHQEITKKRNAIELDDKHYKLDLGIYDKLSDALDAGMFGTVNRPKEYDNDILNGISTDPEQKVSLNVVNGHVEVLAGKEFQEILQKALDDKSTELYRSAKIKGLKVKTLSPNTMKFLIQPNGGWYKELQGALIKMYLIYCNKLLMGRKQLANEEQKGDANRDSTGLETVVDDDSYMLKDNEEVIDIILASIEALHIISWNDVDKVLGVVKDQEAEDLGTLSLTTDRKTMYVKGNKLKNLVQELEMGTCEDEEEMDRNEEEE